MHLPLNWIIESENGTFAIFRILGDSNLVLNQSTILIGDGILGNGGDPNAGPGAQVTDLGAIFIKANDYNDGQGGRSAGEALDSGDTVFSFNDTVLNGVGIYDLIVFDEENNAPFFDNGTTELKINNGQGCAHFISPKINFNNVRFERCSLPEGGGEEQTNIASATGTAFGVVAVDSGDQTIVVSSTAALLAEDAAATSSSDAVALSQADAEAIAEYARQLWSEATGTQLQPIIVTVADLPGNQLGSSNGSQITLDVDAAGTGWFIDTTPADSVEFDPALGSSLALTRYDLLTVAAHEVGHTLGLGHTLGEDVMAETLTVGTRQLPTRDHELVTSTTLDEADPVFVFETNGGVANESDPEEPVVPVVDLSYTDTLFEAPLVDVLV